MASRSDNDKGHGKGKGKGKERDEGVPSTRRASDPHEEDGSLMSRIANSTVGLANSMLSGVPSNSILASAVSEKGSTSAAAGSRPDHAESSVQFRPDITTGSQPFRSAQVQGHVAEEEAAFSDFLDSTPVFQPAGPSDVEAVRQPSGTANTQLAPLDHGPTTYSSVSEQERHDGAAVVSLLMDTNEYLPDHLEDGILSAGEKESLRKALFGQASDVQRQDVDWNHVLNFIPEYLRHEEQSVDSYLDTGLSDPAEAWQAWVGQWEDVLTRYDDEVWGDLGSLVKEARQEVEQLEQVRQDEPAPETPALRRLRAILGHLRGG
ncbi:hypothetical protein CONLIGDRAFT_25733 [Coniochaeta ligniaria NRRL 30616]|uniref:Uncharacterized protein n=1 Tax=Coniochaeta ligniaria NRRL 30616 TaxID=1408157 RepID=A0A1J7K3P0_9PEZI|nr:hypothetical protein CONLIGDRAFT_25733 [Coniochaeta ligniaria NRRL 30616]